MLLLKRLNSKCKINVVKIFYKNNPENQLYFRALHNVLSLCITMYISYHYID